MNMLKNDKGEIVCQEGAENSPARVKCQYPALFERLDSLFCQEARIDKALEAIREWGINEEWKTLLILEQTMYAHGKDINIIRAVTRKDR